MDPLWLLKGRWDAAGWGPLEKDARQEAVDVVHFDRDAWALVRAAEAPAGYEGLEPGVPPDGLYVDTTGYRLYVLDRQVAQDPRAVVAALGEDAERLLDELGDPDAVLEQLNRVY